jgi:hypothetical protein
MTFWGGSAAYVQARQPHQPAAAAPVVMWMPVEVQPERRGSGSWTSVASASSEGPGETRRGSWASTASAEHLEEPSCDEQRSPLARFLGLPVAAQPAESGVPTGDAEVGKGAPLSTMEGSRAFQAALDEAASNEERAALARELRGRVWEALRCPSANHALQKCIEVLPGQATQFIFDELVAGPDGCGRGIYAAARHRYGCRVLQRLVEQGRSEWYGALLDALVADSAELSIHAWGNYVIQHVLEHAPSEWRGKLLCMVEQNIGLADTKPYARAVVSKAIENAEDGELASLARAISSRPGLLASMACTRHGYSGLLHLLKTLAGAEGQEVRRQLTEEVDVFRRTRYGRIIVAVLRGAPDAAPEQ